MEENRKNFDEVNTNGEVLDGELNEDGVIVVKERTLMDKVVGFGKAAWKPIVIITICAGAVFGLKKLCGCGSKNDNDEYDRDEYEFDDPSDDDETEN